MVLVAFAFPKEYAATDEIVILPITQIASIVAEGELLLAHEDVAGAALAAHAVRRARTAGSHR